MSNVAYVRIVTHHDGKTSIRWGHRPEDIWHSGSAEPMPEWAQERLAVLMTMVPDDPWGECCIGEEQVDSYGQPSDDDSTVSRRVWFTLVKQDG